MDTNTPDPGLHSPPQAVEETYSTTKQSPDLAQVRAPGSSPLRSPSQQDLPSASSVSSSASSEGGIQLHTPTHANLRANSTLITAGPSHIDTGVRDISPSSVAYFHTSPTSGSQANSSSPLQQSLVPRYPPPNSSAVSSFLASPVRSTFPRPRHPRSNSPDAPLSSSAQEDSEESQYDGPYRLHDRNLARDPTEFDEGHEAGDVDYEMGCATSNDGNDVTNKGPPVVDDAEDVMNPPNNEGEGFVLPHVEGVASLDVQELEDIMEAMLDSDSPPTRSVRRASSSTGQLATPSSVRDFSNARVQFATNAPVQDTPFAKTLKYFKQFKDKENTPSKSRRNASLPEEIAELAKDAQQEGIEDNKEMWDEYRKIDLAPMDPIMGDQIAGDLIMGTPVRKTVSVVAENPKSFDRSRVITIRPKARGLPGDDKNNDQTSASLSLNAKVIEGYDNETGPAYIVDIPGHFNDAFQLRFRTRASVELIASFLRERGDALDASEADIDSLVEKFLEFPNKFAIRSPSDPESPCADSNCDMHPGDDTQTLGTESAGCDEKDHEHDTGGHAHRKQVILYQEDPISKIIGLIPGAMFWAVAQPIAHYSNKAFGATSKAYDLVLEKLTGLSLDQSPRSE